MYRKYIESLNVDNTDYDLRRTKLPSNGQRACISSTDERSQRFFETSENVQSTDLLTFFSGEEVTETMNKIRESIVEIREKWDEPGWREQQLRNLFAQVESRLDLTKSECREKLDLWRQMLMQQQQQNLVRLNWCDEEEQGPDMTKRAASFIREYTDSVSYEGVYKRGYETLRSQQRHTDEIFMVVLLVEILNIHLYNVVHNDTSLSNFTGKVYRGMKLSLTDCQKYRELLQKPIQSRYISIPLSLNSTSQDISRALDFSANNNVDSNINTVVAKPVHQKTLLTIHVIGLDDEYLTIYRKRFPGSKVSTICAVPIEKFSNFSLEKEVLLRGAFFQLLRAERDPQGIFQIECMMLNSNRDHLSTARLGDDDTPARTMFGLMVQVTRYRFILDFCRERELLGDLADYERALATAEAKLTEILGKMNS